MSVRGRSRFPRSVYAHGSEPDARFSLANERTFLAGIRTALALLAGGVALELVGMDISPVLRSIAALLLVATGIATAATAWFAWARTERALRLGAPLPSSRLAPLLGASVVVAGALLAWGLAVR